jgi:hypothetical protein
MDVVKKIETIFDGVIAPPRRCGFGDHHPGGVIAETARVTTSPSCWKPAVRR